MENTAKKLTVEEEKEKRRKSERAGRLTKRYGDGKTIMAVRLQVMSEYENMTKDEAFDVLDYPETAEEIVEKNGGEWDSECGKKLRKHIEEDLKNESE